MNAVNLTGRISSKKPSLDKSGNPLLNFTVIDNKKILNNDTIQSFYCVAFGKKAQALNALTMVGDRVTLTGRLEWQTWKKNETAPEIKLLKIIVSDFELTGKSLKHIVNEIPEANRKE